MSLTSFKSPNILPPLQRSSEGILLYDRQSSVHSQVLAVLDQRALQILATAIETG